MLVLYAVIRYYMLILLLLSADTLVNKNYRWSLGAFLHGALNTMVYSSWWVDHSVIKTSTSLSPRYKRRNLQLNFVPQISKYIYSSLFLSSRGQNMGNQMDKVSNTLSLQLSLFHVGFRWTLCRRSNL